MFNLDRQVDHETSEGIPKMDRSTTTHTSSYMQTIDLYWHIKTFMKIVLTDIIDYPKEMIICMAELMDKMDRLSKRVSIMANKLEYFDFSSSNNDSEPKTLTSVDSQTK